MKRSVVIHAHFYQPPRENPEFGDVEAEASAAPYHDWNQRIERECYRAVVAARLHGAEGRIARVMNTLAWTSFNVGPRLFHWLERHAPDTARRMVEADRASMARLGHGNAIAHPYHHVILPLASRRDKVTEVRWGITEFRRGFGREPEGMWLPETAVDDETLDVLAQEGIRFTILAPHQMGTSPPNGLPGRYVTPGGREIALFPYHGDISHGIAFGGLVRNADQWLDAIWHVRAARRKTPPAGEGVIGDAPSPAPLLVSAATDGETYGHHHKFAEMALARVLERCRERGAMVENYASFLARHPATHHVTLVAPTAWSCAHGVERWRSDCGCRMDAQAAPSQAWRTPLREGLEELARGLHEVFEREGEPLLGDVHAARDAYGEVVAFRSAEAQAAWTSRWVRDPSRSTRALELLEMEHDALRMFTSCAWFFDDIDGLESRQVLRYARRAIRLSGAGSQLETPLRDRLGAAASNRPGGVTGATVYDSTRTRPGRVRVAAAAQALRDLRLDVETHLPRGFDATVDEGLVHVVDRATQEVSRYRVTLASRSSRDLEYAVAAIAGASAEPVIVPLTELPEGARHAVRTAMRDALLPRCLTVDELTALASGAASLRGLAAVALTRTVARLGADDTPMATETAEAALDLFEQLEVNIPFDTQTVFWEMWEAVTPERREALGGIARRLGFAL